MKRYKTKYFVYTLLCLPFLANAQLPLRTVELTLMEATSLYEYREQVLEVKATLPKSTKFLVNLTKDLVVYPFRNSRGSIERSSSGFYPDIELISVPGWDAAKIEETNSDHDGRYLASNVVNDLLGDDIIDSLPYLNPKNEYLQKFEESGKAKFNFSSYYKTRFQRLNFFIDPSSQSPSEQQKWHSILSELQLAGSREKQTDGLLLYIETSEALKRSIKFEQDGTLSPEGSWTVAVKGTAKRHGFEHVPCAEFMSEMLRGAYARAGYSILDDFNSAKGNPLLWSHTAAVVNLANALHTAGWIPWEAAKFKPVTGAIAMHYKATTPGHAYMIAGAYGRYIVDNGSPRGRDLGQTSASLISKMYMHGVFFLPPGINPEAW